MRQIIILLFFFQMSVYGQANSEDYKIHTKLYFSELISNGNTHRGTNIKLKANEVIDASISLKSRNENETAPAITSLILYVPGYPEINIEGNQIDRETALKIQKTKAGDVIVIKPGTENDSRITVLQIEITE